MALSLIRFIKTAFVPAKERLFLLRMFRSSGTFLRLSSSETERVTLREQGGAAVAAVLAALSTTALSLNTDN